MLVRLERSKDEKRQRGKGNTERPDDPGVKEPVLGRHFERLSVILRHWPGTSLVVQGLRICFPMQGT